MSQLAQPHLWQLGSHAADRFADHSAGSSGIAISAVCASCGLVRVQVVASMGNNTSIFAGCVPARHKSRGRTTAESGPKSARFATKTFRAERRYGSRVHR